MNISFFSLAVTITGTFIGAGFVSGQELWQFFGVYGIWGVMGFTLAVAIICTLSAVALLYSYKTGNNTFDKVVCVNDSKILKTILTVFQFVFYIGVYVIMTAGVQALVSEYSGVNRIIVGAIFCLAVTLISLKGVKGLFSVFSAVIPLLVLATVFIAAAVIFTGRIHFEQSDSSNSLLSNWLVSSLVFVSYNFFAGIGVFASVGKHIGTKKKLVSSTVLASLFLLTLGLTILLSVTSTESGRYDMPMLSIANTLHPTVGIIYAVLLFLAMLGAGTSSLFPVVEWFKAYFPKKKFSACVFAFAVSAIAVVLSLFGFSELIGTVYPIFGYIGFMIIICVIFNFFKKADRRNK